jgi:hypothetical protein
MTFLIQSAVAQTNASKSLKKENKIFLKEYGFTLPTTAEITNKLITPKTKVTFLFIKIPVANIKEFESSFFLQVTNTEQRVVHSSHLIGWLPGYNLEDEPEDFMNGWVKINQLNLGVFARILILGKSKKTESGNLTQSVGKSKYAVIVIDDKKGFMEIRYKR